MDPILILGLILLGIFAGIIGTMFGLGGGIIFVPVLTIIFGLAADEAIAISLVGIVATSAGAASIYVKRGTSNVRLGLLMEITTVVGAICGAFLAVYIQNWILLCIFAAVLIYGALRTLLIPEHTYKETEITDKMTFEYTENDEVKKYHVDNIESGMAMCTAAGLLASMTGVGGGTIKVPLMNLHMHVPIKVAAATSNYMIGLTAFSGAIVYFLHGDLLLDYAAAITIGAFVGSLLGSEISKKLSTGSIRQYLSIVMIVIAFITLLEAGGIL